VPSHAGTHHPTVALVAALVSCSLVWLRFALVIVRLDVRWLGLLGLDRYPLLRRWRRPRRRRRHGGLLACLRAARPRLLLLVPEALFGDLDGLPDARLAAPTDALPGGRVSVTVELAKAGGDLLRGELEDELPGLRLEPEDDG
jgi:hypothetical protein